MNVLYISLNTNYDSSTSTEEALDLMLNMYRGSSWHYTSPLGVNPDLHHALLGRDLNGGLAYPGVLCDPELGFGVSTGLNGDFVSMGNSVIWDMKVVSIM